MGKQQVNVMKDNGAGVSVNAKPFLYQGTGLEPPVVTWKAPPSLAEERRDSLGPEVTPPAAALDPVSDGEWLKWALCFKRQRQVTPAEPNGVTSHQAALEASPFLGLRPSERLLQAGREGTVGNRMCQKQGGLGLCSQTV